MPITAVVLAHNEAHNIGRCLQSLQWVAEVLVLDSGSTDGTAEIVQTFHNAQYILTPWQGYAATKQLGVDRAQNDCIFWVDADEEISDELRLEIINNWQQISNNWQNTPVYTVPRKTFFMGEWIKYCGWYPDRQKRLFHRQYAGFNAAHVHEDVEMKTGGGIGKLKNDILHYSFQSISTYFDKMNRYGKLGAEEMQRKGKKVAFIQLVFNPLWAFLQSYFIKLGILQGKTGFIISFGHAYSKFIKYVHFYYLEKRG